MAQVKENAGLIRQRAPHVDFLLGTHRLHALPDILRLVRENPGFHTDTQESEEIIEGLPAIRSYPFKALIQITHGCDNFCSYCIVPHVRGRETSREMADVLAESRLRVSEGALELMFLGQNVNAYGKRKPGSSAFCDLLYQAQQIDGLERIRFMTSHPRDFSPELIRAIADCPKVARHIHLPVQSGANHILQQMNRGYRREEYLALIEEIRSRIPQIVFTTDIIVGFPGETDMDLRETIDLLEQAGFAAAFTFMYSPRRGTPAAAMPVQIPQPEKKARLQAVIAAQAANSRKHHERQVGKVLRVLAEEWADGRLIGRAEGNESVQFPGETGGIGRFHAVRIKEALTWSLKGGATSDD